MSTYKEPIKGWVDNFNGPIGLIIACGKGIVRVTFSARDIIPDYMAVDLSIKSMIVAAWHRTQTKYSIYQLYFCDRMI